MTGPTPIVQSSVNMALFERTTRSGRDLIYRLAVIQQPERARACGAGNKAQADRRPVDPPPVAELRIFEGKLDGCDPIDSKTAKDITFEYSANFFLFATLEHARAMAHGRVQHAASAAPPVLTGMPVSGMAYLDRPHEAGYFLFPDLSIRHEGRYRLRFSLFEQTKHEADFDIETDETDSLQSPEAGFNNRMEIKSAAFSVYSAKKFPGLQESTALSKVVADQGCRVRIRREVRMRKRESKRGDDSKDEYAQGPVPVAPSATPDMYRARSMSNSSEKPVASGVYSGPDGQRRPSGQDYRAPRGYLQFGSGGGGGGKAPEQFAQPSFASPQQQQHQQQRQQAPQQSLPPQQPLQQQPPHAHARHLPPPIQPHAPRHTPISPAPPSASPFQRHPQSSPYPPPAQQPPYHAPSPTPAPYGGYSGRPAPAPSSYAPPSRTMTPSHDPYDRRPSMHSSYTAPSPSSYGNAAESETYEAAPRSSVSSYATAPTPQYPPHPQASYSSHQPSPRPYQSSQQQQQQPYHVLPPAASFDQPPPPLLSSQQQQYQPMYPSVKPQHSYHQALPPISTITTLSEYKTSSPRPLSPLPSAPFMSSRGFMYHTNTAHIEPAAPEDETLPKPVSPNHAGAKRKLDHTFSTDDKPLHNGRRQEDDHHVAKLSYQSRLAGGDPVERHQQRLQLPDPRAVVGGRRTPPGDPRAVVGGRQTPPDSHEYPMTYYRADGSLQTRYGVTLLR